MNKKVTISDKSKVAICVLNASGWKEGVVNPELVGVDSIFFYVFDYETKWTWCCSVPKDSFFSVLKQSKKIDQSKYVECCGHMISLCASSTTLGEDNENDLGIALTAYIGITKTYDLTEQATKSNHFSVIRYGSTNTIRPFALAGSHRHFIRSDDIKEAISKVIAMDVRNHPEWMAKS
jgi:hypothetical protein